jgi:hypothetical protein
MISSSHLFVKPDSSRAAGTLLMTWLAATEVITSLPPIISIRKLLNSGILPILPMKMKNPVYMVNT